MKKATDMSAAIFDIALTAKRPVKTLMEMAKKFVNHGDWDNIHSIDAVLTGMIVDYIRRGILGHQNMFADDMLAFLDSNIGDKLKSSDEGRQYYCRWEHSIDLCHAAIDNYEPNAMTRFIESKKHGKNLMQILHRHLNGVRVLDLSGWLNINDLTLTNLLKDFESQNLITIACPSLKDSRDDTVDPFSLVRLDFLGRAHMSDE
ncbi:hypothetical protein KAJ61_01985 [Candidatus Parcubacteria bacterium]|nr:hypothetical protein [Candidatus Parcubacteria bacterium]